MENENDKKSEVKLTLVYELWELIVALRDFGDERAADNDGWSESDRSSFHFIAQALLVFLAYHVQGKRREAALALHLAAAEEVDWAGDEETIGSFLEDAGYAEDSSLMTDEGPRSRDEREALLRSLQVSVR